MDEKDISYSDFNPPHHSSMEEPSPETPPPDVQKKVSFSDPNPPTPEVFDPPDTTRIIRDIDGFLDSCIKKVMRQEKVLIAFAYRVTNAEQDLSAYVKWMEQLNSFGVHYDSVFREYLTSLSQTLPPYGDFSMALQQTTETHAGELPKESAEEVSRQTRDTSYAGGCLLKAQYILVKDVNKRIPQRILAIKDFAIKKQLRMDMMNNAMAQLKKLTDEIIQVKTQLHYLTIGEMHHEVSDFSRLMTSELH